MPKYNYRELFSTYARKIQLFARKSLFPNQFDRSIQSWFLADGDNSLKQEFELTPNSYVMDVGGFNGQWSSDIFSRYLCNIDIFEPVALFSSKIKKRFVLNNKIKVHDYGLSSLSQQVVISVCEDASSIYRSSEKQESVLFRDIAGWLCENSVKNINLIKINIEGGEYELLDRIISAQMANVFENFLIQFHEVDQESRIKMLSLQNQLAKTHRLVWQFPFVWERWKRKDLD